MKRPLMNSSRLARLYLSIAIGFALVASACRSTPTALRRLTPAPLTSEQTVATDEAYPQADGTAIGRATLVPSGDMPRPTLRLTPWPRLTALPTVAGGMPIRFELLARSGGQSGGVGVDGRLAYLIVGGRIEVIDAADPRRLARLGRTSPLRHAPKLSSDVVAHGGIVAAATGDGVVIVDARDPRSPVEAGWIPLEGEVMRLVGDGRMVAAFVSLDFMGPSGVQLLDVSDPDHPRLGGFVELIGRGSALSLQDDVLWALTGASWEGATLSGRIASEMGSRNGLVDVETSGLRRIDVSDLDHPREIPIADIEPVQPRDDFLALAVDSERLYAFEQINVGDGGGVPSVRVAQVRSDSPDVDILGEWRESDSQGVTSTYRFSAQLAGRHLVISHEWGVKVFDVSDPRHPADLPELNAALAQLPCRLNALPAGSGDQIWLPCADGPRIVDVGENATEIELGRYAPPEPPTLRTRSARAMPALFAGDMLWTADDGPTAGVDDRPGPSVLEGWRVPAFGEPVLAGTWSARWAVDALASDGGYLYAIGNDWGDVSIVDVHDPDRPVELAHLERSRARQDRCAQIEAMMYCGPKSASSAVVVGGTLLIGYLSGSEDGSLEMIDVQDPRHPVEAGWFKLWDTGDLAAGIEIAWALNWRDPWASLSAIDLRQVAQGGPMVQEVEGLSQTPGGCMAAMGHRAFVAQLLASSGGPSAQVGANGATLAIRSLAADPDGSVRVTDAITLSQQAHREYAFPSCVAAVDDDLMVLHIISGVQDYPGQLYAIDVSNPDRLVVRGAYRGEEWPIPFAIRDHTMYELSDAGLSRWSIGP